MIKLVLKGAVIGGVAYYAGSYTKGASWLSWAHVGGVDLSPLVGATVGGFVGHWVASKF